MAASLGLREEEARGRLEALRRLVAQPAPGADPKPARFADSLLVGSRHHALDVDNLLNLGVTAVLNCAPSGVRMLPCDAYEAKGIQYRSTNVRRDDCNYRILHTADGVCSEHLQVAKAFYDEVAESGGRVLFFCVAGQNRSATLAVAVLMLCGHPLDELLAHCATVRPFILENKGFQQQIVELEAFVRRTSVGEALDALFSRRGRKRLRPPDAITDDEMERRRKACNGQATAVRAELRVPGLYKVFEVELPAKATISAVKHALVERVNHHLATESSRRDLASEPSPRVGKSWLVYQDNGASGLAGDVMLDLVLEEEALESELQLAVLQKAFGLDVCSGPTDTEVSVCWRKQCYFELVIFSVVRSSPLSDESPIHEAFTFQHHERAGAHGTLLMCNGIDAHLRAWDFGSGAGFRSQEPIVFSFSKNCKSKRDFVDVSSGRGNQCQSFDRPSDSGNGATLGMGANAIVHRVELVSSMMSLGVSDLLQRRKAFLSRTTSMSDMSQVTKSWDAAVKRPFNLLKMLAFLNSKSEAGVAKRLRMAGALNKHGRLLYFYGLGIALASNSDKREEYKFETVLLSRYQEEFSTYTLKQFMDDYTTDTSGDDATSARSSEIRKLQQEFSLITVKVLLVSLLNGFRDLTLMGIQAFDFNHLNNVLISRDHRKARIIDIDGESKGSIQFPSKYIEGSDHELHMPALDIDLSTLLPVVVSQLICGKGRGMHFVTAKISEIKRAPSDEDAKRIIKSVIHENFFANAGESDRHLLKVVEWFHALLLKRKPWTDWTNDIYDAMRCIDHLPIS